MWLVRKDVRIVSAHLYCARKFTRHVMNERARLVIKWTKIGQMAFAIALLGFNDLGRSVTPTLQAIPIFLIMIFKNEY